MSNKIVAALLLITIVISFGISVYLILWQGSDKKEMTVDNPNIIETQTNTEVKDNVDANNDGENVEITNQDGSTTNTINNSESGDTTNVIENSQSVNGESGNVINQDPSGGSAENVINQDQSGGSTENVINQTDGSSSTDNPGVVVD